MMRDIQEILKKYWGYDTFLPLQQEAMVCALEGRDSVVVLPTGGGKSLCFQAPAMALPGLAVVVSPLISLMKDQVDALTECGIPAARLDSSLSPEEQREIIGRIRQGKLKLVYLAPERLVSASCIELLKAVELSLIAVDEAHCVSMWGHDFRPEYRALGILKQTFPDTAIHSYTATATMKVREDIADQLRLDRPEMLVGSFDRPNLVYKVERRTDAVGQVCAVLDRFKGESGIVYCIRRADVDELNAQLCAQGYRAVPYHAGMAAFDRKKNQEAFITEKIDTIVATIAFGMGIDKSNVRYVIHAGMPKSLEHYQQESGRAGRDGLEAECRLLYSGGDYGVWKSLLANANGEARSIALGKLNQMYDYCTGVGCRHAALLDYFGQQAEKENCAACDICLGEVDSIDDAQKIAQKILACVVRLNEGFGADYTSLVLVGSREQRILRNGHDKLSTYGLLSDRPKSAIRDWIEQLVSQDFLRKTGEFRVLAVTDKGWQVIRGQETPRLLKPARESGRVSRAAKQSWAGVDRELFEEMRLLRRELAEQKSVPAFVVFSDAALRDMARRRPSSQIGFMEVHGVGQQKNKEYGAQFVAAIVEYCRANGVETDAKLPVEVFPASTTVGKPSPSIKRSAARRQAFHLFEQGATIAEVAQAVDRAMSTTVQYLVEYIQQENIIESDSWVDRDTFARVSRAARDTGVEQMRPIFEKLEGGVDYDRIRICMACLRNMQ